MSIKQPEAPRLAEYIYDLMDGSMVNYDIDDLEKVAAELLTQHSRITELESQLAQRFDVADMATAAAQGFRDWVAAAQAISAEPAGATEMENLQRTAVGWQERALRAERNWVVCRRWAIAGGAPVEKLGDDPDQPFHAASPAIEGESNV